MDYVLPFRGLASGRVNWRALTEHDVLRARGLGADVLAHWRDGERAHAQRAIFNFTTAGLVPLFGCLVLGWSTSLVGIAVSLDVATVWLCDLLALLLAREQVGYQLDWFEKVDQIVHVARALWSRPSHYAPDGTPPEHGALLLAYPEFAADDRDMAVSGLLGTFFLVATGVGLTTLLMLYSNLRPAHEAPLDTATIALLATAVLPRIALTVRAALTSRDAPGSHPELAPQAVLPALALCLTLLATVALAANLGEAETMRRYGGIGFVALYCLFALLAGAGMRRAMWRDLRTIEALLGGDVHAQLARVRHFRALAHGLPQSA